MTTDAHRSGPPVKWTKQRVADSLRAVTRSYGRLAQPDRLDPQPGTRGPRGAAAVAEFERGDYPHASLVRRVYGTWGAALATVSRTPAQLPYTHRTKRRAD